MEWHGCMVIVRPRHIPCIPWHPAHYLHSFSLTGSLSHQASPTWSFNPHLSHQQREISESQYSNALKIHCNGVHVPDGLEHQVPGVDVRVAGRPERARGAGRRRGAQSDGRVTSGDAPMEERHCDRGEPAVALPGVCFEDVGWLHGKTTRSFVTGLAIKPPLPIP